jgi:ArsR family transcriptional regulator
MDPLQFFKCLADETRLRCMLLIEHEGELCVCELTEALQDSQPKISRHLAQLRGCNLLIDRRQGQWIFYRINPGLPDWAQQVLTQTLSANAHYLKQSVKNLQDMGDRPERAQACC